MSKVTGKDLQRLIEGALNEKITLSALPDLIDPIEIPKAKAKDIKSLANNDKVQSDISQDDVSIAFKAPNKPEKDAANFIAKSIKPAEKESNEMIRFNAKAASDAAEFTAGEVEIIDPKEIVSIAYQSLQPVSADPEDNTVMGQYPEGIGNAMSAVFSGVNSFKGRLEKLAEVCKEASNPEEDTKGPKTDAIAKLLVFDYVSTMVQQVDSGSSAYMFESFLAMLVGGRVSGKEKIKGKMTAVDFKTADGSLGSSKYYGSMNNIGQSAKGFKVGEPVFYVIAIKQFGEEAKKEKNTAPRKIVGLKIYNLVVTKLIENKGGKDYFAYKYNNGVVKVEKIKTGSRLNFSRGLSKKGNPQELKLLTTTNPKEVPEKVDADINSSIDQFKVVSSSLQVASEKSQAYGSTGDIAKGDDALKSLKAADDAMLNLAKIISGKDVVNRAIQKETITKEHILKLIEESFNK